MINPYREHGCRQVEPSRRDASEAQLASDEYPNRADPIVWRDAVALAVEYAATARARIAINGTGIRLGSTRSSSDFAGAELFWLVWEKNSNFIFAEAQVPNLRLDPRFLVFVLSHRMLPTDL